jgi:hypothetical protein
MSDEKEIQKAECAPVKQKKTKVEKGRHNKIYRTPATPEPEELLTKERTFVLDSNAVGSISTDYSKTNPKLGPVIPPYNSQKDIHVRNYYEFEGVPKTLKRTGQVGYYTIIILFCYDIAILHKTCYFFNIKKCTR